MLIVNIAYLPGKKFEVLGLVKGNTVQAKHIGKDFLAGFRNLVGGEINEYTEMINDARETAMSRMEHEAIGMGADAILNLRFASADISDGAAEVIAYGTAVKFID